MYGIKPVNPVKHTALCILVLAGIAAAACTRTTTSSPLTADESVKTANSVREFAATVANDVTQRGPVAWRSHFADTPSFYMAAEGRLVFTSYEDAERGIQKLTESIAHVELRWGEPLRVDPLTPTLAALGMPYHEIRVDTAGHKVEESGYFTGLAELSSAGWRFRNAHWSVTSPPSSVP